MQRGLKFCRELQNCLTASSYWGCRGRTTGGARELLQRCPVLSFHKPTWQLTPTTSCFQGKTILLSLSSHTHYPSCFKFRVPPHTMSPYSSSQSPQKAFSVLRISCINLKGGTSGSSSCLFCDISDYNVQWTIVTIINHQHLCNFWDETKTQKWTLMS